MIAAGAHAEDHHRTFGEKLVRTAQGFFKSQPVGDVAHHAAVAQQAAVAPAQGGQHQLAGEGHPVGTHETQHLRVQRCAVGSQAANIDQVGGLVARQHAVEELARLEFPEQILRGAVGVAHAPRSIQLDDHIREQLGHLAEARLADLQRHLALQHGLLHALEAAGQLGHLGEAGTERIERNPSGEISLGKLAGALVEHRQWAHHRAVKRAPEAHHQQSGKHRHKQQRAQDAKNVSAQAGEKGRLHRNGPIGRLEQRLADQHRLPVEHARLVLPRRRQGQRIRPEIAAAANPVLVRVVQPHSGGLLFNCQAAGQNRIERVQAQFGAQLPAVGQRRHQVNRALPGQR